MRILVFDYSGHPFQAELSTELASRGHEVTHSWCAAHVSGRGRLSDASGRVSFVPVGVGRVVDKHAFLRRVRDEVGFAVELGRLVARLRPEVVLVGNTPIPMLAVLTVWLRVLGVPWVLWHQDVQGVAAASFAGSKLSRGFLVVARMMTALERWSARQASRIVVIAEGFLAVHREWGTLHKTSVVPNWAPLGDIVPVPRDNGWAREHDLAGRDTILYSGTLGLKHRPELLVALAREVRSQGTAAVLGVVTEGRAVDVVRTEAQRADVPVVLEPFQPFERLSEVLGSGDVLVVLLEESAGTFSVPSKTLSYLCAGRPVLGLMPADNPAARLVLEAGGLVLPPVEASLARAAQWVVELMGDDRRRAELGRRARRLAEREFDVAVCGHAFEDVLLGAIGQVPSRIVEPLSA